MASAYSYDDTDAGGLLTPSSAAKRKRHQVRIQGRLVLVRSVSAVNLPATNTATTIPPMPTSPGLTAQQPTRHDPGVGSVVGSSKQQRRQHRLSTSTVRRSYGGPRPEGGQGEEDDFHDGAVDTSSETEEDEQETAVRDRQRRGYGIGGAGNIRRPTEVVQFYSRTGGTAGTDDRGWRRRWQWMSSLFLGLRGKKEGVEGVDRANVADMADETAARYESS